MGEVGDELAVEYIVVGSYLKEADNMRLTVEMVDVETEEMIWREPIEVQYQNAFDLQDLVSQTVLTRLEVAFSGAERNRMQTDVPTNPLAYEYYLRAVSYPESESDHGLAIQLLNQSLEIDSTFASAWSELGHRKRFYARFLLFEPGVSLEAEQALLKALEINPDHIEALSNLAALYTEFGKLGEAVEIGRRLVRVNPNYALGHYALGYVYRYGGMLQESAKEMAMAISLDSTDMRLRTAGNTFFWNGQYEESVAAFKIGGESPYVLFFMARHELVLGRPEKARDMLVRSLEIEPEGLTGLAASAMLAHTARVSGLNNDIEGCLRLLRKSVDLGYANVTLFERDPGFDTVRGDPRFLAILEDARRKHEEFEARFF